MPIGTKLGGNLETCIKLKNKSNDQEDCFLNGVRYSARVDSVKL